jgi:hypothetical protein
MAEFKAIDYLAYRDDRAQASSKVQRKYLPVIFFAGF